MEQRARAGLFLGLQYPQTIAGVTNATLLRAAINARRPTQHQIRLTHFLLQLDKTLATHTMPESMADRYLLQGFSGGQLLRNTILQHNNIHPTFGLLDEIDSGLDIHALRIVAKGVNYMRGPQFGRHILTHYQRLLDYIIPDVVHDILGGRILTSGGPELAKTHTKTGYTTLKVGHQLGTDHHLTST